MATFAQKLRVELDRQGLSIRQLARRIDPGDVERGRRNLHRWLSDPPTAAPSPASRRAVEAALEIEEHGLDDDAEEEESVADILRKLAARFENTAWVA